MAEAKSIEALSLFFTAGAAAGTMLSGSAPWAAGAAILPLASLPFFLRGKLLKASGKAVGTVFCAVFVLLGLFCALNASLMPEDSFPAFKEAAAKGAETLRGIIGSIPFRSSGTAPLLDALLTGDRSGLSRNTVTAFRQSGASHILALSGLHMGIIYLLFDKLTGVLGRRPAARHIRFWIILLASGYFTVMTGASPSIVRAFLFISINETLKLTGRPRNAVRVLCLALLIQLAIQPRVISTLGFQLSYLAMAGVFILYPVMEKWYPESRSPLRWIWKTAAMAISCQVFTGPLVWLRFHTFPRYFLLANLLALPIVTVLMTVAVVTIALQAAGICPQVAVWATDTSAKLLTGVLEIIASLN